jgi:antitoxin VapB
MFDHMPRPLDDRVPGERQVRLFRNGRNQALRIPRDLELPGRIARLRKEGPRLVVEPLVRPSLLDVLATLQPIEDDLPAIPRAPADPVEI